MRKDRFLTEASFYEKLFWVSTLTVFVFVSAWFLLHESVPFIDTYYTILLLLLFCLFIPHLLRPLLLHHYGIDLLEHHPRSWKERTHSYWSLYLILVVGIFLLWRAIVLDLSSVAMYAYIVLGLFCVGLALRGLIIKHVRK